MHTRNQKPKPKPHPRSQDPNPPPLPAGHRRSTEPSPEPVSTEPSLLPRGLALASSALRAATHRPLLSSLLCWSHSSAPSPASQAAALPSLSASVKVPPRPARKYCCRAALSELSRFISIALHLGVGVSHNMCACLPAGGPQCSADCFVSEYTVTFCNYTCFFCHCASMCCARARGRIFEIVSPGAAAPRPRATSILVGS